MAEVYIYSPGSDDWDGMGLCGALTSTSCIHEEEANGMSELTLTHPIDVNGRWSFLLDGYVLKADIPVRTTSEIADGKLVTTIEKWQIKPKASKSSRGLFSKATKGKRKKTLPQGLVVTVVAKKDGATRHKIKHKKYGTGWVAISAMDYTLTETIPNDPAAIEEVEPAWNVRSQFFRIYDHEVTDTGVTAHARHIFYDMLGNCTTYNSEVAGQSKILGNPTATEAGEGILDGCVCEHEFEFHTNMADTRADVKWVRINPVSALLDPDEGLCAQWQAELIRDDWDIVVLREAGLNRGLRIEYAKNLLGVSCQVDTTDVITRIIPLGQTSKGGVLQLSGSTPWVDSPKIDEYPVPHVLVMDLGSEVKAKSTKTADVTSARNKLIARAQAKFDDEECDTPSVSLKVDFLALGETEEYRQYAQMESLFLYDHVRVMHPDLQIDVLCEVKRMEFDCLTSRVKQIELGSVRFLSRAQPIASWQLPEGINAGTKLARDSISEMLLAEGTITSKSIGEDAIEEHAIVDGAVSPQKLSVGFFEADVIQAALATITTANIQNANIDWAHIASLTTEMAMIAVAQITAANIERADIQWASIANLNAQIAIVAAAQITAANIERANIQWAEIASLNTAIASIARAQITTANINTADIDWAQIASLQAGVAQIVSAQIGVADIDYARIKDLVSDTAIITTGVSGQLYINKLAVTEANMVSLTVGELMLKGADGQFYRLSAGPDGTVTTTPVLVEGSNVAGATLSGGNLIENTITCRELNVGSIFADSAMIGAIQAANINVGSLFASNAYITALRTNIIQSDIGAALDISSNAALRLKADKTVTDELTTRLSTAEQKITPDAIISTVTSSEAFNGAIAAQSGIPTGGTAPTSPEIDQLWLDTSIDPNQLKVYDGELWQTVNNVQNQLEYMSTSITQTAEQITQYVSKADQSRYLSFSATNGVLIGDTATSYKVQILSDRVNILQNGAVIAYFASSKLFITEGELTSNLVIGNYGLKKTVDGGIAIG